MKVAVLTPLPPARTGIAYYASMLLPALRSRLDVTAFDSAAAYRREDFDQVIYQLGNNPHHEWIYALAMREPGVVVLHDLVLHHLIVEMTLARGDAEGYVAALEANHGAAGAAWARGRAAGLHSEMGNFLLPASVELARRSRAVIVHNEYAASRLRSFGVSTPIHVVPHPYVPEPPHDGSSVRVRHGLSPSDRVIGLFGFLTSAKRAEVVLEAFRLARARDASLRLLIVGEPAPNIDVSSLAGEGVVVTGYVADEEFGAYYAAADRLVNLRYPTAGETSGTLIRAFEAGKPVAVSDYAQFAEYPCAEKIPLGRGEVEALADFFVREIPDTSQTQRAWLEQNARLDLTVDGYVRAIGACGTDNPVCPPVGQTGLSVPHSTLVLFPKLALIDAHIANNLIAITVRNDGDATIRTRSYSEPGYRLLAKLFDGPREVQNRWLELPRDLPPGQTATVTMPWIAGRTLRLYDALEGIALVEPEPWGERALAP